MSKLYKIFKYIRKLFSTSKVEVQYIEVAPFKGLPRFRYWFPILVNWSYRSLRLLTLVAKQHYRFAGASVLALTFIIGFMAATP